MGLALGRYELLDVVGLGGMATVHLGRLREGPLEDRVLAIKRLKPEVAREADFALMFADEAEVALRIAHQNVVSTYEIVRDGAELALVMDYIHGETLATLARTMAERGERLAPALASTIAVGILRGLHAAHEACDAEGRAMNIVHRDVSPQNVIVATDGVVRVLDFGVAKAARKLHQTRRGEVKGKFAYMAPEQIGEHEVTRRADIHAAGVVFWELLTGERLYSGKVVTQVVEQVLYGRYKSVAERVPGLPVSLDELLARALAHDAEERYSTASEMADAVEAIVAPVSERELAGWVTEMAAPALAAREALIRRHFGVAGQ